MKILHLATFDTHGGAAVAAIRLVDGLRRRGHDARLLVRDKATSHAFVDALANVGGPPAPRTDPAIAQAAWLLSERARSAKSDAPFSSDVPTYAIADLAAVRGADVLHLHWVAGFVSAFEIGRLQRLGKPLVWTLHDEFPFTGGCHYAQSCHGFVRRCDRCPQLQPAAQPLARLTLAQKRDFIDPARVVLAAPSRWLARRARDSALFRRARIEVVPYGIDVAARQQVSREAARVALDIPDDAIVLFTSSMNHAETRKGHAHLVRALESIRTRRLLGSSGVARRLLLLTAGEGASEGVVARIPSRSIGSLAADDPRVEMAYRAADVFVLPSLDDNLPNTLLEAMAAGVPVVAYRTGGVPDALNDDANGRMVRRGDVGALARALADLLVDPERRRRLGDAAAETARRVFDLPVQTAAFERIYDDELRRARTDRAGGRGGRRMGAQTKEGAVTLADVPRLKRLMDDPKVERLVISLLHDTVNELQRVVAARGGEIRDWRQAMDGAGAEAAKLQEVIAARGGEIRDLWARVRQMEAQEQTLQDVIAARVGEIRDLRADVTRAQAALAAAGGADRIPRRVGVFGAGEGGRKVLASILALDHRVEWLSDNDPRTHGRRRSGIDVIAPDRILATAVDLIVIGSTHRDVIRKQLLAMGVPAERVVAPDVSLPDAEFLDELRRLLGPDKFI